MVTLIQRNKFEWDKLEVTVLARIDGLFNKYHDLIVKDRNSKNIYYIIGSDLLEELMQGCDYVLVKGDNETHEGYFFDWNDYVPGDTELPQDAVYEEDEYNYIYAAFDPNEGCGDDIYAETFEAAFATSVEVESARRSEKKDSEK